MKAMILAAGMGTRLKPLTDHTPKPLLPLKGQPLLYWQLRALQNAGITQVVINVRRMIDQFEGFLAQYDGDMEITLSIEDELLETGGGVVNALHRFGQEPFIIMNGDIWSDFEFTDLPESLPGGSLAHLVLTPTPDWRAHGDFESDESRITARGETYCYCSIGLWSRAAFDGYEVSKFSLRDVFFRLMEDGKLSCQIHRGVWHDIGTLEQYQALR